ncbi:Hemicentin-2 [Orchesella cincta]|uniref:Hemicentin-2 n=1 Tax=Orchesella cincta TaxID=48709 RepID=A0A1D2NLN3_ORCCI|nr:Hemicentin-2 [Orchesella cincta]
MKKSVSLRIVSLLLTFVLHDALSVITARASETNPKIVFTHVGNIWNNVSNGSSNAVYYSTSGSDLFVSCTAPYPIQWNINGIIAPAEIVKMLPPKRNLHENMFEIRTNYFFLSGNGYAGLAASAQIACEKVGDDTIRDYFSVFVRGNNPFVEPATKIVTDSKLIPCPTTDPTSPTMLYLQASDGTEGLVNDVTYNPIEGFRSDNVFDGIYICKKESSHITIVANASQALPDHQFSPTVELIKSFSDEPIEFTCSSKTKSIKLKLEDDTTVALTYSVDTDQTKTAKLSLPEGLKEKNVKGKVTCMSNDKNELIKEWSYEFIEAPELYLDNFEGEVDCLSPLTPKMAQTVRCRNSMDCQFMDHCFQNETLCNFKKQKQFFATDDTFCWIEKLATGRACASVPYSHLNGRVQCTVLGLTKKYDFFISLDSIDVNSTWKDAPEKELLRMDATPEILYTESSSRFFCTGSAYLFADSLSFEIEYKNGTKRLLQDDGKVVNISNPYSENLRKIDEFNVLGVLNINLPIDAIAIHCLAPWWNSTDIMTTSSKFETRQLLAPTIPEVNENEVKVTLYINAPNQRLTCFAKGEPQPKYQWLFRNDTKSAYANVEDVFPSLTTILGSNGKSYLEFPSVSEMNSGEFKCAANNSLGNVSQIYQVQVSDKKNPCLE